MKFIYILLVLTLTLASCDDTRKQENLLETVSKTDVRRSGPDAKPGLTLDSGRLVLPAVSGNPGAAYFELSSGGDKPVTLAAVTIDGAERAEMHETAGGTMAALTAVPVAAGQTVSFAPGGKHVMVFGLAGTVTAGSTVDATLTFTGGDKLSVPFKVEAVGGGDAMAGMNHGSGR